ncbi:MAG: hypothetical protein K0S14_1619 [Thermomicrobiales bacterium]|nr:hypothetical protein [Thermomicrobiales bacterium]MDF2760036.1 hypothetical protein [Thermomicrobiales bacterium]
MGGASCGLGLAAIEGGADAWTELRARIGRYLVGLLERIEREAGSPTTAMGTPWGIGSPSARE